MRDVIVRPHGSLVPGSDCPASIALHAGGAGANAAAWLARFGARVALAARVGAADHAAQSAALARAGVIPCLAADPDRATGALVALIDAAGERSFLTDRGANAALDRADLPDALLPHLRHLHVAGYALFAPGPRAAVREFAAAAVAHGVPWSVDAASTGFLAACGPAAFLAWTDTAALFFANEAEAALLADDAAPARQLAVLGVARRIVVLKRGAAGAIAGAPGTPPIALPAPPVEAAETVGAGDAFLAGFLAARLRGAALTECLAAGIAAGARAAAQPGGQP
ncbi:MAG: carbohydrate kinase family protein [Alphaproteobacteria bacterium]|nr:carbohydrate kinase family protein [Alphaproteobacteria bacterium]